MSGINPSSPQLALVKKWLESYTSLNIKNVEPLLSKNFQVQRYPRSSDLPDETRESHLEGWEARFSVIEKGEVISQEVIEAPGKVVVHISTTSNTVTGEKLSFDAVLILTFVEEDGELKILNSKSFGDVGERRALFTCADKAKGSASS